MELVLFAIAFAFIVLSAVVVRMLGTSLGYKVLFVAIAFVIVLKTLF